MALHKVVVSVKDDAAPPLSDVFGIYGFKAASDNRPDARPVVWFFEPDIQTHIELEWEGSDEEIYVTKPRRKDSDPISSYSKHKFRYRQKFVVENSSGGGEYFHNEENPTHMEVLNSSDKKLRFGLAAKVNLGSQPDDFCPYCENVAERGATTSFRLVEKVILFIAQSSAEANVKQGSIVANALSSGVVVDAAAAEDDTYVTFDSATGEWDWEDGQPWVGGIDEGDDLTHFARA
ncbi:hypothetical protein [Streptomyces sp. NPDC004296]|uniref:hypothetical protein n=1 Tax=Streptomyces sp. NPDC004296 TaxID=3364697 RepID=UPI00367B4629